MEGYISVEAKTKRSGEGKVGIGWQRVIGHGGDTSALRKAIRFTSERHLHYTVKRAKMIIIIIMDRCIWSRWERMNRWMGLWRRSLGPRLGCCVHAYPTVFATFTECSSVISGSWLSIPLLNCPFLFCASVLLVFGFLFSSFFFAPCCVFCLVLLFPKVSFVCLYSSVFPFFLFFLFIGRAPGWGDTREIPNPESSPHSPLHAPFHPPPSYHS